MLVMGLFVSSVCTIMFGWALFRCSTTRQKWWDCGSWFPDGYEWLILLPFLPPVDCSIAFPQVRRLSFCAFWWGPSTRWASLVRWPPRLPWQQKYSRTMWRLCWWVLTSLVQSACCLDTGITGKQKSIIVTVVCLLVSRSINNFSAFRVVWRFSQDSGSFWGRRLEAGSTSRLDMKSLFCFLDVSCWLWFPSTYTSCQPSVILSAVSDERLLFLWF